MAQQKKIALITGGSRGLGKSIALKLAARGVSIILTYNTREAEAAEVVTQLSALGVQAKALQLQVDQLASFPGFFKVLGDTLKNDFKTERIDYLVNNAGVGLQQSFASTTEEQFDLMMNVHFKGVYFLTQQAVHYLHDGATVVNMSSRLAQASVPGYSAYAAMKGAIETLSRYQAKELADRKIRVNTVAPGPIATDFGGGVVRDNPQFRANAIAATALGRIGEADDISGLVAFLCSDDAHWITAQRIEASGGMNL